MSYIFTAGIDSVDTWVLCDPKNETRDLRHVFISSDDTSVFFGNLLNIFNFRGHFNSLQSKINCFYIITFDKFLTVDLYVQGKLESIVRLIN